MTHFDIYGRMAAAGVDEIHQNGRYLIQKDSEKHVPADVIKKLRLQSTDTVRDIGCGMGTNLYPMAKIAAHVTGCDHPNVIQNIKMKNSPENVSFFGGNFLHTDFPQKYKKLVAYSVLHALPDKETLYAFVEKTLSLCEDDGIILFGDMANVDKKARFLDSKRGAAFQEEWARLSSEYGQSDDMSRFREEQDTAVIVGDQFILDLLKYIRGKRFHAYICDQPSNLPFGNTREDIIIYGPEYENKG